MNKTDRPDLFADLRLSPKQLDYLLDRLAISNNAAMDLWPVDRKRFTRWREGTESIPIYVTHMLHLTNKCVTLLRLLEALPPECRPKFYGAHRRNALAILQHVAGHKFGFDDEPPEDS